MGMGMVGFSSGREKRYTAGIEWILQQFQMYNKDFDYPVYGSSHFFLFPLSLSLHILEQYSTISCNNRHHNLQNHSSLSTVTCAFLQWHEAM